jgi:2-desacetyl-2-hydroxyethyl bacteriochlorophyllide A dehydrogenase
VKGEWVLKVAIYEGYKSIRFEDRPKLQAGPGEVVVKVKYCGICGTDLHAYLTDDFLPPGLVLGHESVGVIEEIGSGVEGWNIGDRVAVGPPGLCGECYYCKQGKASLCLHTFERTNGLSLGHDGSFAEYVKACFPQNQLFKLPDTVPFEEAVFLDTVAVVFRSISESRFKVGDNVIVTGAGSIGLSAVQLLKHGGAKHITVIEPSVKKRELAIKFGADVALNPLEEGVSIDEIIKNQYDGIGADVVFECSGSPQAVRTCVNGVKGGGQIMIVGVTEKELPIIGALVIIKELEIKGTLAYGASEVRSVIALMEKGGIRARDMLSDIISLDDFVEKGFERLVASNDLVKIAVDPHRNK